MRWPITGLPWIATSPNVPSFEAALAYPGMGLVGETFVNEGRGTPMPFSQFGAPWLDAGSTASHLNGLGIPGVEFKPTSYTPRSIPNVAANPRFESQRVNAVRLAVTDVATYRPLDVGIHVLAYLQRQSLLQGKPLVENPTMFHKISGTARLFTMLGQGADGTSIIASWQAEAERFKALRARYLLY